MHSPRSLVPAALAVDVSLAAGARGAPSTLAPVAVRRHAAARSRDTAVRAFDRAPAGALTHGFGGVDTLRPPDAPPCVAARRGRDARPGFATRRIEHYSGYSVGVGHYSEY
jgi:hypothetical protein